MSLTSRLTAVIKARQERKSSPARRDPEIPKLSQLPARRDDLRAEVAALRHYIDTLEETVVKSRRDRLALQQQLTGYRGPIDGEIGPATIAAARRMAWFDAEFGPATSVSKGGATIVNKNMEQS